MTTKRIRNALNANGAIEILDDGTVQFSDKTTAVKTPVSNLIQGAQDSIAGKSSYRMNDSSLIDVPLNSLLALGTSAFCEIIQFKASSVASAVTLGGQICNLRVDSSNYCLLGARADAGADQGKLQLVIVNAGSSTTTITNAQLLDNKPHTVIFMRDASNNLLFYVDGVLATIISGPTTSTVNLATACRFKIGEVTAGYNAIGQIYKAVLFNYASTDLTKLTRYSAGAKLDYEDIGGSMVDLVSSWANAGSYNTFTTSGNDITSAISTGAGIKYAATNTVPVVAGKRYRVRYNLTLNSGEAPYLRFRDATYTTDRSSIVQCVSGANEAILTCITTDTTAKLLSFNTDVTNYVLTVTDIVQLGAVLDLEPESMTPTVWHDESGNSLDGFVTSASLVNVQHFANTDYGPAAVKQELLDSVAQSSYYIRQGSTDNIETIASPQFKVGTGDFTMLTTAKVTRDGTNTQQYMSHITSAGKIFAIERWYDSTSGIVLQTSNGVRFDAGLYPEDGKPFTIAVKRYSNGTKVLPYLNGYAGKESTVTAEDFTADAAFKATSATAGTKIFGEVYRNMFFNYALSEDKIRRYSVGSKLDYEDVGGSMVTRVVAGDMTDATKWNTSGVTGGTIVVNGGSSGVMRWNGVTGGECYQYTAHGFAALVTGKKYRLSFQVSNWVSGQVQAVITVGGSYPTKMCQIITDMTSSTTRTFSAEFTATGAGDYLEFYYSSGTGTFDIDNVSVIQLGAVLDWEPENIAGTVWGDASTNGLHGTVTGALANRFVPSYSSRNYLINGALDFWQRGPGSGVAQTSLNYVADRWYIQHDWSGSTRFENNGLSTDSQAYGNAADLYNIGGAGTYIRAIQPLEVTHARLLAGKWVTLSATIKSGSSVNGKLLILTSTTANQKTPATVTGSGSFTFTTTAKKVSITAFIPTGTLGLAVGIENSSASAGVELLFTDVQLNEGSVAAPFERAGGSIAGELALCQRYCWTFPGTSGDMLNVGIAYSTTTARFVLTLPVQMRQWPTLGSNTPLQVRIAGGDGTPITVSGLSLTFYNTWALGLVATVASGLTAGQAVMLFSNANPSQIPISCEL